MIKRIFLALFFFWISTQCSVGYAKNFTAKDKRLIATKIKSLIKEVDPAINIGIDVRSLKSGQIVYQRNASRLYTPASNIKLLTAETAFLYLGRDFRFDTRLLIDGEIHQGALNGNLYVKFDGDPTLKSRDLKKMISTLKEKGIQKINGNVYIDKTAFDNKNIGPGWMWDELRFCYASPVNAIIVNHNCMPFRVHPPKTLKSSAKITVNPDYAFFTTRNNLKTVSHALHSTCPLDMNISSSNQITLSGCLTTSEKSFGLSAAVSNVNAFGLSTIKTLLDNEHIHVSGKIHFKAVNEQAQLIVHHLSAPLSSIIKTMLKKSDNVIANAVFKKIGQRYSHQSGTWDNSEKAMLDILHKRDHLAIKQLASVDGSGLSRYDLASPSDFSKLLLAASHRSYFSEFKKALPTSGIDGTLKYRLGNKALIYKVSAKTGTMSGVSTLSGYVKTRQHGTLAFSILINGFRGAVYPYRQLEDAIVAYLATR